MLSPPSNGKCSSSPCSALEGGRLNFTCNNGYLLKGVTDLVCLNTGEYTAAVPECIGKRHRLLYCIIDKAFNLMI